MNNNITNYAFEPATEPNITFPSQQNMGGVMIYPQSRQQTMPSNTMASVLEQHLGNWARIEFLVGDTLVGRVGRIAEVGNRHITLTLADPQSILVCDLPSIRFATIIDDNNYSY